MQRSFGFENQELLWHNLNVAIDGGPQLKKTHISILIAFLLSLLGAAYAGPGKAQRIALEELRLTLLDNGSVVDSLRVSEREARGIIENVKADVLKSFGVDNAKALVEKGLIAEFDEAVDGRLKVERIVPPRLRFYDADGKIVKEMLMRRPGNSKRSRMGQLEGIGTPAAIDGPISRDAFVSADGESAVVTEYFAEVAGEGNEKYVPDTSSKIQLYDISGKMLWEERAPEHMYVNKMAISQAGEVIAFILVRERGEGEKVFSANRLVAFDRGKKSLLDFTGNEDSYSVRSTLLAMSPGGRYLSIAAAKKDGDGATLFFDVKRGALIEWQEVLVPLRLGDDGIVFTVDSAGRRLKLLDLAKQMNSPD